MVEANQRACLAKARISNLQVLIVRRNQWFQTIQLLIAEDSPPLSALGRVRRLGDVPVSALLVHIRSGLFIRGRKRDGGLHVLRPDHAAAQHQRSDTPSNRRNYLHCWPALVWAPGFVRFAIWTSCPLASESEGSRITGSLGVRPE